MMKRSIPTEDSTLLDAKLATERQHESPVVTYFIQAAHGGPIKIGRSTEESVQKRLASIQTGNPHPLVLCRVMYGDHESDLHARFARHRLSGEWFSPTKEIALLANGRTEGDEASLQLAFETGYRAGYERNEALCADYTRAMTNACRKLIESFDTGAFEESRDWTLASDLKLAFKAFVAEQRQASDPHS